MDKNNALQVVQKVADEHIARLQKAIENLRKPEVLDSLATDVANDFEGDEEEFEDEVLRLVARSTYVSDVIDVL